MSERIYQGAVYETQCPNCKGRYLSSVDRPSQPYERCVKCLRTELNKVSASEAALREDVERLQAENQSLKGGIHDACPDPYQKIRVLEARLSAFEHVQREISPEYASGEGASGSPEAEQ